MLLALPACTPNITGVNIPVAGSVVGVWNGAARWTALQGGDSLGPRSSGTALATIFQSGAAILSGSTWEVTGIYTGTLTGSVDPEGNATGTIQVLVLETGCTSSSSWGGSVEGNTFTVSASFSQAGPVPCGDAPVGLVITLVR
jgi:hypothetical protein